jgi:hypothetical protein
LVVLSLDEKDNGQTIQVGFPEIVDVTLHSTYWQFDPPAGDGPVSAFPTARPAVAPIPGAGTGVAIDGLEIESTDRGTVVIRAHRTTCGEALLCGPDQREFAVTLVVNGPDGPDGPHDGVTTPVPASVW